MTDDAQEILAELASIKELQFIFSVDHVGANRVWNSGHADKLRLYGLQIDTFEEISLEISYMPPLFLLKNDNPEIGISFILKSMTENQREVIKKIATAQLENPEEKGIRIKELLSLCVE